MREGVREASAMPYMRENIKEISREIKHPSFSRCATTQIWKSGIRVDVLE